MAYRVEDARVIAPHRYTEATGDLARYDTPEDELAVNERGAPREAFFVLGRGDLIYNDEADYNSLSDEDKSRASEILMVKNTRWLNDQLKFKAIKELESRQASSEAPEEKPKGRRAAAKPAE